MVPAESRQLGYGAPSRIGGNPTPRASWPAGAGDSEKVVSAAPSENTVRFYLGRGYQLMAEPLPELLQLEPEDVHLKNTVGARKASAERHDRFGCRGAA